jgi:Zn-dependent peptidase ImmA (M78 family)
MGLRIHGAHLPDDLLGKWSPTERRIYFDLSLTENERRSIVAHELGHAHHGHTCDSAAAERQADAYAAALLIHPDDYAYFEKQGLCMNDLADELGVTVDLLAAYQHYCLERIGDTTYARPKMGVGQWQYRSA